MIANRYSSLPQPGPHELQLSPFVIWQDQFTALLLTEGYIGVTSK